MPQQHKCFNVVGNASKPFLLTTVRPRKLFGDEQLIEEFIQRLVKVETLDEGWSEKYLDEPSGQLWVKYSVDTYAGRWMQKILVIFPPPNKDELIQIALTSFHLDEVWAAAKRLNDEEEINKIEFRQELIDRLDEVDYNHLNAEERERIRVVIEASGLTNRLNKRDTIGKHYNEILKDAEFFRQISISSERILSFLR